MYTSSQWQRIADELHGELMKIERAAKAEPEDTPLAAIHQAHASAVNHKWTACTQAAPILDMLYSDYHSAVRARTKARDAAELASSKWSRTAIFSGLGGAALLWLMAATGFDPAWLVMTCVGAFILCAVALYLMFGRYQDVPTDHRATTIAQRISQIEQDCLSCETIEDLARITAVLDIRMSNEVAT